MDAQFLGDRQHGGEAVTAMGDTSHHDFRAGGNLVDDTPDHAGNAGALEGDGGLGCQVLRYLGKG